MTGRSARRGIALPMVLMVMVALALLSSLALFDAVQAWRVALLAEDSVRARAAAYSAVATTFSPPDLSLLCLRPPHLGVGGPFVRTANGTASVVWRSLGRGKVRAEVAGVGRNGARFDLLVLLSPDSLPPLPGVPGCPTATRLVPQGRIWVLRHPRP